MSTDDPHGPDGSPPQDEDPTLPAPQDGESARQCASIAWHGDTCKNKARPGHTTCRWHDDDYAARAAEFGRAGSSSPDYDPALNPKAWKVRCNWRAGEGEGENQCKKWAVKGTLRCDRHGGAAVKHIGEQHMKERAAKAKLLALLQEDGQTEQAIAIEEFNPLFALSKLAIEVLAMKDMLLEQVTELAEEDWVYGDRLGIENVRAVIQLYERAVDRTSRLLVDIGRLNLDERLMKISERQGNLISEILQRVLGQLGLDDEDRARAQTHLASEFRKLDAVS